jgi:hypothetical protein
LKVEVIPVFPVDQEEGILEAFVHWGPVTDSAKRAVSTVNDNIPSAIRLGPIARDNDCNFVGSWEVPTAPITIVICCELNRNILTIVILEYLRSVLEDVRPAVICEDEVL